MITMTKTNVKILYGNGASMRLGMKAKEMGLKKVMLITDKGVYRSGIVDPLMENLKNMNIQVVLYDGVLPDPPDTMIDEAGAIAKQQQIDGIVAIGGGSTIDTAKAVNVLVKHPLPIRQWFTPAVADGDFVPLILLPTTAGTGSECTGGGVITDSRTNQKTTVAADCNPFIIIDPRLYVGLPVMPSVYCAFDVITHSIDAICHNDPEPIASTYGEKALRLVYRNLPKIVANPEDLEARGAIALAATLGGAAIGGSMCHLTHSIGHSLGTTFHLPHGLCCTLALPELLKYYAQWLPDRMRLVAENMDMNLPEDLPPAELGETVSRKMLTFMKDMGVPSMKELNLPLNDILEKALPMMPLDFTLGFAPHFIGLSKFKEILESAYAH